MMSDVMRLFDAIYIFDSSFKSYLVRSLWRVSSATWASFKPKIYYTFSKRSLTASALLLSSDKFMKRVSMASNVSSMLFYIYTFDFSTLAFFLNVDSCRTFECNSWIIFLEFLLSSWSIWEMLRVILIMGTFWSYSSSLIMLSLGWLKPDWMMVTWILPEFILFCDTGESSRMFER